MSSTLPYCGLPPLPGDLLHRFNLDPWLLSALLGLALLHCLRVAPSLRSRAASGWMAATVAFASPLCALSVSLFSARIAQHMLLMLVAAPLLAAGLPAPPPGGFARRILFATAWMLVALWTWHMPVPYQLTFQSTAAYWCMHLSLFGGAIWLWRELLHHPSEATVVALAAGLFTSMQMGLLGALLTLANRPLFSWHAPLTAAWGLSPLQDQVLGGLFMWVPGILLFLWVALRSLHRLRLALEPVRS